MTEIEKLIERLEKATGPDRELDARIELTRRSFLFGSAAVAGAVIGTSLNNVASGWIAGLGEQPISAPHYTSSIDAALTLVPEGWKVDFLQQLLGEGYWTAGLYTRPGKHTLRTHANSDFAAIALCIAALRAMNGEMKRCSAPVRRTRTMGEKVVKKKRKPRAKLSRYPQNISEKVWYYEETSGIVLLIQKFDSTITATIPWKMLEASLRRYAGKP